MSIRVMLVDDQQLLREGIKSLLSLSEQIAVVAQANDGEQAMLALAEYQIDVVLMDIRMPVLNGIETLQKMAREQVTVPVIMLTTFDDHSMVLQALQAGAKGYLLKDVSLETLVEAIETVHGGKTLIQPAITERLLSSMDSVKHEFESFPEPELLSEKELEILRLMAAGCSNKEISDAMHKSLGTVKNQVSTILAKLGVRDRTRAVLKAIETGVL